MPNTIVDTAARPKLKLANRFTKGFRRLRQYIVDMVPVCNPDWSFEPAALALEDFAQGLLAQILIVYLVQSRGWLATDLNSYFRQAADQGADFYQDFLQSYLKTFSQFMPGFHDILFCPAGFKETEQAIQLPNWLFAPEHEKSILSFFNSYQFDLSESASDLEVITPQALSEVFEQFWQSRQGVANGTFYTPRPVVQLIVRQALAKYLCQQLKLRQLYISEDTLLTLFEPDNVSTVQIGSTEAAVLAEVLDNICVLDPAVGGGAFLVGTLDELIALQAGLARLQPASPIEHWSQLVWMRQCFSRLYGIDLDPMAIQLTQVRLGLWWWSCSSSLPTDSPTANLMIGDALQIQLAPNWPLQFDLIVGNPPYIFTRNGKLTALQKIYYRERYQHQGEQLNTASLFIEQAYHWLAPQGVLGFITPCNWLTTGAGLALRKFLLSSTADLTVWVARERVFSASVDTAIISFRKAAPTQLTVGHFLDNHVFASRQLSLAALKPPQYIFPLWQNATVSNAWLADLEAVSRPLGELAKVSTGLKAYQTHKGQPAQTETVKSQRSFHSQTPLDPTYRPYLQGADVRRYQVVWSGQYLRYGVWLAEPRRSVPFQGARLLVRQIPAQPPYLLHATFTSAEYYHDINSMVVFAPSSPLSLKYLLGLLNSRLLSAWFAARYDKLQRRVFPQFKVHELASFPIRPLDLTEATQAVLYERIVQAVELRMTQTEVEAVSKLDGLIDQLVYEVYQIDPDRVTGL